MTTPDLIAYLLRQADIASSPVRGDVYREAAGRLGLFLALMVAAEQAGLAIALHAGCETDQRLLDVLADLDEEIAFIREAEADGDAGRD